MQQTLTNYFWITLIRNGRWLDLDSGEEAEVADDISDHNPLQLLYLCFGICGYLREGVCWILVELSFVPSLVVNPLVWFSDSLNLNKIRVNKMTNKMPGSL